MPLIGLLCAPVLTLIVLPVIYLIFAEKLKWIKPDAAPQEHQMEPDMDTQPAPEAELVGSL